MKKAFSERPLIGYLVFKDAERESGR